jgi:hypothetical protein
VDRQRLEPHQIHRYRCRSCAVGGSGGTAFGQRQGIEQLAGGEALYRQIQI